jgi:hypothetical protein
MSRDVLHPLSRARAMIWQRASINVDGRYASSRACAGIHERMYLGILLLFTSLGIAPTGVDDKDG